MALTNGSAPACIAVLLALGMQSVFSTHVMTCADANSRLYKEQARIFERYSCSFYNRGESELLRAFFSEEARRVRSVSLGNKAAGSCVVLDVGANVGNYASDVLRVFASTKLKCGLVGYEPVPPTFDILQSLSLRKPFTAINKGIGDVETVLRVQYRGAGDESASFSHDPFIAYNAKKSLCKECGNDYTDRGVLHEASVAVTTVDLELLRINVSVVPLVKIDVEALEFKVLQGMRQALASGKVQAIQWERHHVYTFNSTFSAEVAYVDSFGYSVYGIGVGKRSVRSKLNRNNLVLLKLDAEMFQTSAFEFAKCRFKVNMNVFAVKSSHPFNSWATRHGLVCDHLCVCNLHAFDNCNAQPVVPSTGCLGPGLLTMPASETG